MLHSDRKSGGVDLWMLPFLCLLIEHSCCLDLGRYVLVCSEPPIASSSCLRRRRSFEINRLCVFVTHPGAGPAIAIDADFFPVLPVTPLMTSSEINYFTYLRPKLRICGQWVHDLSKKGFVTPIIRPDFGGILLTNDA